MWTKDKADVVEGWPHDKRIKFAARCGERRNSEPGIALLDVMDCVFEELSREPVVEEVTSKADILISLRKRRRK